MSFHVPTVTVTGYGAVRVSRGTAVVRVAAVHRAASVSLALTGADSAREVLVSVARRHADARDVATEGLDVWPVHDDQGHASGFEARHALVIRCPDPATAATLVGALASAVGDRLRIEGVALEATPTPEASRIARERAFDDARKRAEHLSGLAGLTLDTAMSVEERAGSASGAVPMHADAKVAIGLEPGTSVVEASVTVTFACA